MESTAHTGGRCGRPGNNTGGGRDRSRSSRPRACTPRWSNVKCLPDAARSQCRSEGSGTILAVMSRRLVPRLGPAQAIGAIMHRRYRLIWKILHERVRHEGTLAGRQRGGDERACAQDDPRTPQPRLPRRADRTRSDIVIDFAPCSCRQTSSDEDDLQQVVNVRVACVQDQHRPEVNLASAGTDARIL